MALGTLLSIVKDVGRFLDFVLFPPFSPAGTDNITSLHLLMNSSHFLILMLNSCEESC